MLLLDGGDLFQGTMVSNLGEGRAVIDGYNALGYTAAAVGNHEFDYGPDGPKSVPSSAADDPTGALKARIASARFPFLSANLIDKKTSQPVDWPNIYPSKIVQVAGISIGLIGAVTEDTPRTTNVLNLRDVQIASIIPAVRAQELFNREGVDEINVAAEEGVPSAIVANAIKERLIARHGHEDFTIVTQFCERQTRHRIPDSQKLDGRIMKHPAFAE